MLRDDGWIWSEKRKQLHTTLADLVRFTEPDLKAGNYSFRLWHHEGYYMILLGAWIRGFKSAKAIELLCAQGLSGDAESVLRTLVELLITIRYIAAENQNERTRRYFEYGVIEKKKQMGAIEANEKAKSMLAGLSDDVRKDLQEQFEQVVAKRSKRDGSFLDRAWFSVRISLSRLVIFHRLWPSIGSWSGHSIETMAHMTDLAVYYDVIYRQASEVIHARDLLRQYDFADKVGLDLTKGIKPHLPPDHTASEEVLASTLIAFSALLETVYQELQLPRLDDLKKNHAEMITVLQTIRGPALDRHQSGTNGAWNSGGHQIYQLK